MMTTPTSTPTRTARALSVAAVLAVTLILLPAGAAPAVASEPLPDDVFEGITTAEGWKMKTGAAATLREYRETSLMSLDQLVTDLEDGAVGIKTWEVICKNVLTKLRTALNIYRLCFIGGVPPSGMYSPATGWIVVEHKRWALMADVGSQIKELKDSIVAKQKLIQREARTVPSRVKKFQELIAIAEKAFAAGVKACTSDNATDIRQAIRDVQKVSNRFDLIQRLWKSDSPAITQFRNDLKDDVAEIKKTADGLIDTVWVADANSPFARTLAKLTEHLGTALESFQKVSSAYLEASLPLAHDNERLTPRGSELTKNGYSADNVGEADGWIIAKLEKRLKEIGD